VLSLHLGRYEFIDLVALRGGGYSKQEDEENFEL
jgi:hypothetical protein